MKKSICILLVLSLFLALPACGQTGAAQSDEAAAPTEGAVMPTAGQAVSASSAPAEDASTESSQGGKALVVYFSWSSAGNTETMANTIAEHTGADILRLEPATPYPTDYNACGEVAKTERDENARPEIANLPENLAEYDTIFVGYPIWWHTAPMIIGTFLENYDWSGKEVYPFSQSTSMDTEQFDNSMDFVRACAKGAEVHDGLFVRASDTEGILNYLTENE